MSAKIMSQKLVFWGFLIMLPLAALTACNTVEGVGRDIEAGGDAIEDTASDTKEKL